MDRVATGVETELPDLSGVALADLEVFASFSAVAESLLDEVEAPPTVGGNASDSGSC